MTARLALPRLGVRRRRRRPRNPFWLFCLFVAVVFSRGAIAEAVLWAVTSDGLAALAAMCCALVARPFVIALLQTDDDERDMIVTIGPTGVLSLIVLVTLPLARLAV
jgi:uncharacterized membrane protein YhaH (DUF805 family)